MKGTLLALILLGLPLRHAAAQLFSIEAEALNSPTGSSTALIEVRATVQSGFSATIFISAEAPTLPGATITATPSMINAPYTDSVVITVHAPQPGTSRIHQIIVVGKNGPSAAFDTLLVEFPDRSAWKWLTREAVESAGMSSYSQVLVDRRNAVAYLIGSDEIGTWDGETVTKLSTFPYSSREAGTLLVSTSLDSAGGVWILKNGVLRRYDIGSGEWMMIDHADPENGLSDTLMAALSPTSPNRPGRVQTGSDGKVWIMSTTGLFCYNPETSTWRSWIAKNSEFAVSSWSNLPTYTTDLEGNVWIAQVEALVKFDGAYTTVYPWPELLNIPTFQGNYAEVFGVDPEHGVWIRVAAGGHSVGVWSFDDQSDRVVRYVPYDEPSIIEAFPLDSVYLDSPIGFLPNQVERADGAAGDIWLALQPTSIEEYRARYRVTTEGGLMRYHGGTWYHYTSENSGIPSNTVTSVVVDSRDQVWIKANGGLVLLNGTLPPEDAFSDISAAPGIPDDHTSDGSLRLVPNPVSGDAELETYLPAGSWNLSIHSILGQELLSLPDVSIEGGHSRVYLPTTHLPPGVYFLQLTDEAGNRRSTMFIRE